MSILKRLLSRIELEINSISVRIEDDCSILDHPIALELKINNLALKHKSAYFEFINISTNQVTKKNTSNDDICLVLKISNISAYFIKDSPMFVPRSLIESAISLNNGSSGIFNLLDMDEFRSMFNLI